MDNQIINCPHCKQATAVNASLAGKSVRCPHCRNIFWVPQTEVKPVRESTKDSLPIITINQGNSASSALKRKSSVPSWAIVGFFSVVLAVVVWNGAYLQNVVRPVTSIGDVSVSGELFFTTKMGTVVRGAGQQVYFSPINGASKKKLVELITRRNAFETESRNLTEKVYDEIEIYPGHPEYSKTVDRVKAKYPRLAAADRESSKLKGQAMEILTVGTIASQANSEGKFKAVLPPGNYVLWTSEGYFGEEVFLWFRTIKVENSTKIILLNDRHIIAADAMGWVASDLRSSEPSLTSYALQVTMLTRLAEEFANSPN